MKLVSVKLDNEIMLEMTREELNILHNAINYIHIQSNRNINFSKTAKEQYKNMLDTIEEIKTRTLV